MSPRPVDRGRARHASPTRTLPAVLCGAVLGVASVAGSVVPSAVAGASETGPRVARVITSEWWPVARAELSAQVAGVSRLKLTRVRCPAKVPATVDRPEAEVLAEVAAFAAGGVRPGVSRTGVFGCSARLDGQRFLVVGGIAPDGDARFASGSLVLSPDRLAVAVADAYATRTGADAQARCPGRTVLVVQPDTPIDCVARDGATRTEAPVEVSVDGDLGLTFSFPG